MYTTFYLKGASKTALLSNPSQTKRAIWIYFRCDDGQFRRTTKLKIRECDWVEKDKKGAIVQRLNTKITGANSINYVLDEWQAKADKLIRDKISDSLPVYVADLEALFPNNKQKKAIEEKDIAIKEHLKQYEILTFVESSISWQGPGTKGQYQALFAHLKSFNETKKYGLSWRNLDNVFYKMYLRFLAHEYPNPKGGIGLFNTSICKDIVNLQGLARTVKEYVEVNEAVFSFKLPAKKTTRNYIDEDELENRLLTLDIYNLSEKDLIFAVEHEKQRDSYNFNHMKIGLEKARDCYVFGFETGMRYSDMKKLQDIHRTYVFDKNGRGVEAVSFMQKKTKNPQMVPLTERAKGIIKKWEDKQKTLLPISQKKDTYIMYLKRLFKLAGFLEEVTISRLKGNVEVNENLPRWMVLKPHTSRHSCAQDLLNKTDNINLVANMLGHTSSKPTKIYAVNNKRIFVSEVLEAKNKPSQEENLKAV